MDSVPVSRRRRLGYGESVITYARMARVWTGKRWADDVLVAIDDERIRPVLTDDDMLAAGHIDGTLLPPLTDAHVHLGLSDFDTAGAGVLARVLDLGWDPSALTVLASDCATKWPHTEIFWAGPFLTAPGGYPGTRDWAPEGSVLDVSSAQGAVAAVDRLCDVLGAEVVKVALNSEAGPVFSDDVLCAVTAHAHEIGMTVVAHVEGAGQARRAYRAGVDAFAHTPWTEVLSSDELDDMVDNVRWISTIAIHDPASQDYATAMDNLTRFVELGGSVAYGTDLGNGTYSAGLSLAEVGALRAAGLAGPRLLHTLAATGLLPRWSATATLLRGRVEPDAVVDLLPTSRPVDAAALREWVS